MSTSSHPILLAALDLDGTLLNSNGEVSPYTQKVLSEASDRGVVVIPATGRPLASLPPVVAKQPWVHYALTSNGAAVWDLGGDPLGCVYSRYANAAEHETSQPECIVRRCFPVEKAREVYEAFHGLPGGLNIFSDGRALRDTAQQRFFDERFARLAAAKGTEAIQPNDGRFTILRDQSEWMSRHAHEVEKFCMFFHSVKEAQQYLPRFTAIEGVEVVQGSPDNIEVTAAGVNKGESLLALADHLGIPREATLAVGDSENDRAMLEKAGVAAVMANGMEHIRKLADIVSENDNASLPSGPAICLYPSSALPSAILARGPEIIPPVTLSCLIYHAAVSHRCNCGSGYVPAIVPLPAAVYSFLQLVGGGADSGQHGLKDFIIQCLSKGLCLAVSVQ